MSNRVVLGKRGTAYGLWVSKPGVNVLTAAREDLLLSTDDQLFQVVAQGTIYNPSNNTYYDRSIPVLNYTPLVLVGGSYDTAYKIVSPGVLRIWTFAESAFADGAGAAISWAVTNQRIWH